MKKNDEKSRQKLRELLKEHDWWMSDEDIDILLEIVREFLAQNDLKS